MNTSCPQCTGPVELVRTASSLAISGYLVERYHCDHCRAAIQVEYQIIPDPPSGTSTVSPSFPENK